MSMTLAECPEAVCAWVAFCVEEEHDIMTSCMSQVDQNFSMASQQYSIMTAPATV